MNICLIQTYLPTVINFRGFLLDQLVEDGDNVWVLCPTDNSQKHYEKILIDKGVNFIPLNMDRKSMNFFKELYLLTQIFYRLKKIDPDTVIAFHPKGLIYTGISIIILKIFFKKNRLSFFPVVSGAGTLFDEKRRNFKNLVMKKLVQNLYKIGLKKAEKVIFQNKDDISEFKSLGILQSELKTTRIYGSGVSLEEFTPKAIPKDPSFLMLSRLLNNKGVKEYLEAAAIVKKKYPNAIFKLAGFHERFHPSAINHELLNFHIKKGHIKFLGHIHNVKEELSLCRFYVLPSYREGTPRSVLEAMATKRAIITTDVPGCRETVIDGFNGYLVQPRDSKGLASAMIKLIEQTDDETKMMALNSYKLAKDLYDVKKVNQSIIKIIKS